MKTDNSLKIILILIGLGTWALVLQNAGIIPTEQRVYITGGYVDVSGSVDVDNIVEVSGSVGVNIEAINGKSNAFYKDRDGDFVVLPVLNR